VACTKRTQPQYPTGTGRNNGGVSFMKYEGSSVLHVPKACVFFNPMGTKGVR
jgi:hypothetical protein